MHNVNGDRPSHIENSKNKISYITIQWRRFLWDRGDVSFPIFTLGGHAYQCPFNIWEFDSLTQAKLRPLSVRRGRPGQL